MRSDSRSAIAIGIVFLVTWGLTTHGKYSASGDEPHYLMIAESLRADRDLDLSNNYAQDDGRLFGHDALANDGHATLNRVGQLGSLHDVGLPILLLPVYAVARSTSLLVPAPLLTRARMSRGLFTYSLLGLVLITLVTTAGSLVLRTFGRLRPNGHLEYLWCLIALSPPVISHAFLVFPEVPMFAVTCLSAETACRDGDHPPSFGRLAILTFLLGCSPWLHRKFSPYAVALLLAVFWMQRERIRTLTSTEAIALALLFLVPFVSLFMWTWHYWGTLLGPQFLRGDRLRPGGLLRGAIGLFADREAGLLAYAPFYLVLPASIAVAAPRLGPLLLAGLCLFLPMAAFDEWWGGFSPAARYLVPLIPMFALSLAHGVERRRIRWLLIGLGALQIFIDALVWQRPRLLWPQSVGFNVLWDRWGPLGRIQLLLPAVRHGASLPELAVFVSALVVLTMWLAARGASASPETR